MSYSIWKQLFGWFLTFEYDLMGNLPLWGTLKNNERTLKNGPKYAKNLEMIPNFFAKRCWQPWNTLKGVGKEERGEETKIKKKGGQARSRGGCYKKVGWKPLTNHALSVQQMLYYKVIGRLSCNRVSVVYLITYQCCKLQYPTLDFRYIKGI